MKIKSLQGGGFLGYTPMGHQGLQYLILDPQGVAGKPAAAAEDLLDKDLIKLLFEKGLSNDVDEFLQEAQKISQIAAKNPKQAQQLLYQQYSKLNKIVQNKNNLESAITKANSNDGLNDIAITDKGRVLVRDMETGLIDQVTAEELKNNRDILRPITNQELVSMRQTDPSLAFNTSIHSIISNGIGASKVNQYILDIASKIGSSKESSEGFVSKRDSDILSGINHLVDGGVTEISRLLAGSGGDGVYKIKSSSSDQDKQMFAALEYILATLPQNMRTYLEMNSASRGKDPQKGALELIAKAISISEKTESSTEVSYDKSQSDDAKAGNSGGSKTANTPQSIMILSGEGFDRPYELNAGGQYNLTVSGKFWETPNSKKDNTAVGKSITMEELFTDTLVAGIVDTGSAHMGDVKLTEDQFSKIVYDNKDGLMTAILPYKVQDGHKVVDFNAVRELNLIKTEIAQKGEIPAIEKFKIYKAHGMEEYYEMVEENPTAINYSVVTPFLMFSGITTNHSDYGIDIDIDNPLLQVNDPHYKNSLINVFQNVMNEPSNNKEKPGKVGGVEIPSWTWFNNNDMITGTIYTAISDDKYSPYSAGKVFHVPQSNIMSSYIMSNDLRIRRKNSSLLGPTQGLILN